MNAGEVLLWLALLFIGVLLAGLVGLGLLGLIATGGKQRQRPRKQISGTPGQPLWRPDNQGLDDLTPEPQIESQESPWRARAPVAGWEIPDRRILPNNNRPYVFNINQYDDDLPRMPEWPEVVDPTLEQTRPVRRSDG